jgi:hypothetical protein
MLIYGIRIRMYVNKCVFDTAGKHHDDLKKSTMDKTLETKLKTGMNTYARLVMTKESSPMMKTHTGNTSMVGDRVQKRWLSYGLTKWFESALFDL